MQGKQNWCLHQLTKALLVMVSWHIVQNGSSEAPSGAAWGAWLVLGAGEEVPCSAKSPSSNTISHCKQDCCRVRANLGGDYPTATVCPPLGSNTGTALRALCVPGRAALPGQVMVRGRVLRLSCW